MQLASFADESTKRCFTTLCCDSSTSSATGPWGTTAHTAVLETRHQDGDELCLLTIFQVEGAGFDRLMCAASCCVIQKVQTALWDDSVPRPKAPCCTNAGARMLGKQLYFHAGRYPFIGKHYLLKRVSSVGRGAWQHSPAIQSSPQQCSVDAEL